MPKLVNSMTVAKVEKAAEAAQAATAAAGPAATQNEAAIEDRLATQKADSQVEAKQVEAAEEAKIDESIDRDLDSRQDATHDETQRDEMSVDQEMDQFLVRRISDEELAEIGQVAGSPRASEDAARQASEEALDPTRTSDFDASLRRGEELMAGERLDLDREEIRDQMTEQEQDVARQGTAMLEEQQESSKAAAEESAARDAVASEERDAAASGAEERLSQEVREGSDAEQRAAKEARAAEDQGYGRDIAEEHLREEVREAWLEEQRERHPALAELDDDALERVLAASQLDRERDQLSAARGLLVEELGNLEGARRAAEMGPEFEHLRADRIQGLDGPGLTDGMIVRRLQDEQGEFLQAEAVLEAKAGTASAQGLERSMKHPPSHQREQRRQAIDELREELSEQEARRSSDQLQQDHGERVQELMDAHVSDDMGQYRKDLERLMPGVRHPMSADVGEDVDARDAVLVRVDGEETRVRASPATTELLAVTPSDVEVGPATQRLAEEGLRVTELPIDLTEQQVTDLANDLLEQQKRYAENESAAMDAAWERQSSRSRESRRAEERDQDQAQDQELERVLEPRRAALLAEQGLEEEMNQERKRLARLDSLADLLLDLDD